MKNDNIQRFIINHSITGGTGLTSKIFTFRILSDNYNGAWNQGESVIYPESSYIKSDIITSQLIQIILIH